MCMYTHGCLDVWMFGCLDVCMYVCMYVCTYVCMCIQIKAIYTSSSRASRGRKFQKKKELYSKERICL